MPKLFYAALASLDGYVEDEAGKFDWAEPDEDVHAVVNDLESSLGTYLYGRRMYETMAVWESDASLGADSAVMREYARIWQATDKIVYSRTLEEAWTARTRIEREFDAERVRRLKAGSATDLAIGGAELAAHALRAGLVDECHLFLAPAVVGGGKRALPAGLRLRLELLGERRFASGFVHLHYRLRA